MEEACETYIFGDYKMAIKKYSELIEKQPANLEALLFRAISYINIGEYDLAIKDLEKVEELEGNNFQAHLNWGIALFYKNEFKNAYIHFKIAEDLPSDENEQSIKEWMEKCVKEYG